MEMVTETWAFPVDLLFGHLGMFEGLVLVPVLEHKTAKNSTSN